MVVGSKPATRRVDALRSDLVAERARIAVRDTPPPTRLRISFQVLPYGRVRPLRNEPARRPDSADKRRLCGLLGGLADLDATQRRVTGSELKRLPHPHLRQHRDSGERCPTGHPCATAEPSQVSLGVLGGQVVPVLDDGQSDSREPFPRPAYVGSVERVRPQQGELGGDATADLIYLLTVLDGEAVRHLSPPACRV